MYGPRRSNSQSTPAHLPPVYQLLATISLQYLSVQHFSISQKKHVFSEYLHVFLFLLKNKDNVSPFKAPVYNNPSNLEVTIIHQLWPHIVRLQHSTNPIPSCCKSYVLHQMKLKYYFIKYFNFSWCIKICWCKNIWCN